jgi:methyl-accepting chemotaxis protein
MTKKQTTKKQKSSNLKPGRLGPVFGAAKMNNLAVSIKRLLPHNMTLRQLFRLLLSMQLVLAVILVVIAVLLSRNQQELNLQQTNHFKSYQLADELRQSSDDLTRLARSYVATGQAKYEQQYWVVVAIRNGQLPRPTEYQRVYWDFYTESGKKPRPDGEVVSLHELMLKQGFSTAEFTKLELAQKYSDDLVKIEKQAMNAVKGLYADAAGNYTVVGQPNQILAMQLMNDDNYNLYKSRIMKPLDDFFVLLDQRTAGEVLDHELKSDTLIKLLEAFVIFIILLFLLSFVIIERQINRREHAELALVDSERKSRALLDLSFGFLGL